MRRRTIIGAMVIGTFVFFGVIGFGVHSSAKDVTKQLQLVHVIVRHGARTPVDTYPKDPHIEQSFYPVGWGQLTNGGKLQAYEIGKFLRDRYGGFLGERYAPDEYYVESTDSDRTKATAQTVNAGLWPPADAQKWGPLDWQPIPVHSQPQAQDQLLLVRKDCPKYNTEMARVMQTDEIKNRLQEHRKLFEELSVNTGNKFDNFDDVQDLYNTLKAEESYNLTLPAWTKNFYPAQLEPPTAFSFVLNAYTDVLKRLKGGVLLKRLLADWHSKRDNALKNKAFLFVGHDATVTNLLRALDVWDEQVPNYGIAVLVELSKDKITGSYGVEIFLRNSTGVPHQLTVPGCETLCPLDKLTELTADVVPDDWDKECRTDDPNYTPPPLRGP